MIKLNSDLNHPTNPKMCITFLYLNTSDPNCPYKLILINNRDEHFSRLTAEADLKSVGNMRTIHATDIDAVEHGTWLGLSQVDNIIRIGNLLNVAGEQVRKNIKGRGGITIDYIKSKDPPLIHNTKLSTHFDQFNGFNFLSIEINAFGIKAYNACNIDRKIQHLSNGFHGLSNSPYSDPYLKVIKGIEDFKKIVKNSSHGDKPDLINSFLNFLKCDSKHFPCPELIKRRPYDAEVYSSIHVRHPCVQYGSRNRSVILVDHFHNIDFVEERMINEDPKNSIWARNDFRILGNVKPRGMFQYMMGFSKVVGRLRAVL